jgi:hypothetical protein
MMRLIPWCSNTRIGRDSMAFLRNLGKAVKIGVTAYITGGIAYWITAEIFIRYIGKEITFTPILSALLAIPFWPMHVYGDLRWIGILPQDVAALLTVSASVPLLRARAWPW